MIIEPEYEIGSRVCHLLSGNCNGLVVDWQYSEYSRKLKYAIRFQPGAEPVWCCGCELKPAEEDTASEER